MAATQEHERILESFLRPIEKPVLYWLAARMPPWVTPDVLTAIGVLGAAIIFFSYWLSNVSPTWLWLASIGFVINWVGDSLDGTLARHRNIGRPKYGFFIDHTVDAFTEMLIVLGLGLTPFVRFDVAALALIGYLLLSVYVYVRTYVVGVFQIAYGRFGPTELRVILIILNSLMFFFGAPQVALLGTSGSIYDLVVGAIAAILVLVFIVSSWQQARALAKIDPPPKWTPS